MLVKISVALLLLAVCVVSAANETTYNLVGCYLASSNNHVLNHRSHEDSAMTIEKCRDKCHGKTFAHFGLLEGDKCYCGNKMHPPVIVLPSDMCAWRCRGKIRQKCGSDQGLLIFKFGVPKPLKVLGQSLFVSEDDTALLFSIKAHTGKVARKEFMTPGTNKEVLNTEEPRDLYVHSGLDNLSQFIRSQNLKRIVAEMRTDGKVVAQTVFDVTFDVDKIDRTNWFSPERLVSSFPYWIGRGKFDIFSVGKGSTLYPQYNGHYVRAFHIMRFHTTCHVDAGFWGVAEQNQRSGECRFVRADAAKGYPSLFYSRKVGGGFVKSVHFAQFFLIYGTTD